MSVRPFLDPVILHPEVWEAQTRRGSNLPHALLVQGPRGIGKRDFCLALARFWLCEQAGASATSLSGTPVGCGTCSACLWFDRRNHPDFRWIRSAFDAAADPAEADASAEEEKPRTRKTSRSAEPVRPAGEDGSGKALSREIRIDQVRALDDFVGMTAHQGGLKVVLLEPAEAMNRSTANAILKTLEEPPPGMVFLLLSHEPQRLLPTLRSRCQCISLSAPMPSQAVTWLEQQGVREAERWLAFAGGAPGQALEVGHPDSSRAGVRIVYDTVLPMLKQGAGVDHLLAAAHLEKALKVSDLGSPLREVMTVAQKWLVDLARSSFGLDPTYYPAEKQDLILLAQGLVPGGLWNLERKWQEARVVSEHPLNTRLFLEGIWSDYRQIYTR